MQRLLKHNSTMLRPQLRTHDQAATADAHVAAAAMAVAETLAHVCMANVSKVLL